MREPAAVAPQSLSNYIPNPLPDLLHGVTLKDMIEHLVDRYTWAGLGERIEIRCFTHDPSVNSSLKFLRKTPWARAKVESLYLHSASHPRKTPKPAAEG